MNILKKLWVFSGASLLVVAGAAMPGKILDDFVDPVQYETPVAEYYHEAVAADDDADVDVKKVIIHYYNTDKKNGQREIYTWTTGNDNKYNKMVKDSDDSSGNYYHIELDYTKTDTAYAGKTFLNFIVKYEGTWAGQSLDTKLDFTEFKPNAQGVVEVWCTPGKAGMIDVYATKADTVKAKLSEAYFTDWKTIHCVADEQKETPKVFRLYAYDKAYLVSSDAIQERTQHLRLLKEGTPTSATFDIKFNHTAHVNVQYVVETEYNSHDKVQSIIVTSYKLYDNANFKKYYNYDGNDLGCTYAADKTTFKLWAPTAGAVILNVYNKGTPKSAGIRKGDASDIHNSYFMTMQPGGVWEKTLLTTGYDEDLPADSLENKYYTYTIYNSEGVNEVCDPYAHACGVNGVRAMILDFNKTNPEGWNNLPLKWDGTARDIKTPQELSIYEIHIRDLTEDKTWTGKARRGTYQAFYEKGTTYTGKDGNGNNATVKTGFDHIEELGVNAIQIMPMFDHDNNESYYYYKQDDQGKETKEQVYVTSEYVDAHREDILKKDGEVGKLYMDFNWGYNPLNYNCVEGSYSSDPRDGAARVKEFKELVMAYANNANKTRVIMDVVYNHVSSVANTLFTKIMPRYYFRFDEKNDVYFDGSGCSNEVKTEAPMMTKYIVDSLVWWAKEYKVKGFRFDLMKLLDYDMLNKARAELYKVDPDIYIYGEGWALSYNGPKDKGGDTYNVYAKMNGNSSKVFMGGFNDGGRNAVRGGNDGGWGSNVRTPGWGFISQGSGDVGGKSTEVGKMLTGNNSICSYANQDPRQTVNYASCHDNYTLYDQLSWTLSETGGSATSTAAAPAVTDVMRASTAINCAIMMSNGVAFMLGGEELFRNKIEDHPELSRLDEDYVKMYGKCVSHNSYKSSVQTNSFKWDRKIKVDGYGSGNTAYAGEVSQGKFTNWYIEALQKAIATRKAIAAKTPGTNGFCYSSNNKETSKCNYFGAGSGSIIVGIYLGGYCAFLNGRGASAFEWAVGSKTRVTSVGSVSFDGTTLNMEKYSGAIYNA